MNTEFVNKGIWVRIWNKQTMKQSVKRKTTFSALLFRAGSMSRDASSSATTNRSYLRHHMLLNKSLAEELGWTGK